MKHRLAIDGRLIELDDAQLIALATGRAARAAIPSFEQRVLWRVCENGTSMSATTIAAEEWQGKGDPANEMTVTWALEALNESGLVTYRMSGQSYLTEQPCRIRATKAGYLAAGYPPPTTIVGPHRRYYDSDSPKHPGDRTDFRNLFDIAIGGPIERDSLENHLTKYPTHSTIHPSVEDLMSRDQMNYAAATGGKSTDPRSVAEMTVAQIMEEQNLRQREAYKARREATAEVMAEGASDTLAHKILTVLKNGPIDDIDDLRSALFFAHEDLSASNIDITKAIWSLQKRNLVTFYERKRGRDSLITKIKLTRNGATELGVIPELHSLKPEKVKPTRELKGRSPVGKDFTDAKHHPAKTSGGPVERIGAPERKEPEVIPAVPYAAPSVATVIQETPRYRASEPPPQNEKKRAFVSSPETIRVVYPLIDGLLTRADKKGSYEAAAKSLEGIDDEMALELLGKVNLSPFEEEVVSYVRSTQA